MKKYIVLSVNDNPEYLFYLPLTAWAWRKFGWEPIVFFCGDSTAENKFIKLAEETLDYLHKDMTAEMKAYYRLKMYFIDKIDGYGSDTVAQISRLYAACIVDSESYVMTGDIDMIPLSDYWQPDQNEITVWGWDLTTYEHIPICYIGMPARSWNDVMQLNSADYTAKIKRDLDAEPNAKSSDAVKRWVVDQDVITERLSGGKFPVRVKVRGMYPNAYPIGRVDRSAWTLDHPQLIDCHMPRGIYSKSVMMNNMTELLKKVWPEENFGWFYDYRNEFKNLLQ